jgi:hypothetical protein
MPGHPNARWWLLTVILWGGDLKNETRLNKPILRCKPGPGAYTSVNLKAKVIGVPPGQATLIAVENDWWRNVCLVHPSCWTWYILFTKK